MNQLLQNSSTESILVLKTWISQGHSRSRVAIPVTALEAGYTFQWQVPTPMKEALQEGKVMAAGWGVVLLWESRSSGHWTPRTWYFPGLIRRRGLGKSDMSQCLLSIYCGADFGSTLYIHYFVWSWVLWDRYYDLHYAEKTESRDTKLKWLVQGYTARKTMIEHSTLLLNS